MEFNKKRVYQIPLQYTGTGGNNGSGVILSSDFGDWLDLPAKNDQIYDEQILIQYKLDLMSYPAKAILYLVGQFGLNPEFEGSEIIIGVLPLNTRPKHQLKQNFTAQGTEIYLVIETNGEVKLQAISGDLPVTSGESESDPYFLNVDYNPQIDDNSGGLTFTATRTQNFTRNNCGNGMVGTSVTFGKTYTSNISQADANNQRTNDADFVTDGQAWANDPANGATCELAAVWYATRTESFTRSNCAPGSTGTAVNFSKQYSSYISQADADNKAATDPNYQSLGEAFANDPMNGAFCELPPAQEFYAERSESFTRNNCGAGMIGTAVEFIKNYVSGVSQAHVDNMAASDSDFAADGQAFANDPDNGATCEVVDNNTIFATIIANPEEISNSGGEISYNLSFHVYLNRPLTETVRISGGFQYKTYPDGGAGQGAVGPSWSVTIPAGETDGIHDGLFLTANSANSIDTFTYPGLTANPSEIDGITIEFQYD